MPVVVDPNTGVEREVSQSEFDQLSEVGTSSGWTPRAEHQADGAERLWDFVDEEWTAPLPSTYLFAYYTKKEVVKCSACIFADRRNNAVESHVRRVREAAESHRDAEIIRIDDANGRHHLECSGCNTPFDGTRRGRAQAHIYHVRELGEQHNGPIEMLLMRRYGLGPSEPTIYGRAEVAEAVSLGGTQVMVATPAVSEPVRTDVNPLEQPPPRKGRRRRSRGRGRA